MKRALVASFGFVPLGVASAADIHSRGVMPAKALAFITPIYNWTAPYIGISGSGGWGNSDFSEPLSSGNFNTTGGLIGGTLGYNY
jgi:outer membrane immunogenic protein